MEVLTRETTFQLSWSISSFITPNFRFFVLSRLEPFVLPERQDTLNFNKPKILNLVIFDKLGFYGQFKVLQ